MKKILFVCTGNTCRSPMAEAVFNKMAKDGGITGYTAESAGISAYEGSPASGNATAVMNETGIDISGHRARNVTREVLESSAAVYCMTEGHAAMLKALFPEYSAKIKILGGGIPDPFGGSINVYRSCRNRLTDALKALLETDLH